VALLNLVKVIPTNPSVLISFSLYVQFERTGDVKLSHPLLLAVLKFETLLVFVALIVTGIEIANVEAIVKPVNIFSNDFTFIIKLYLINIKNCCKVR
jgi:hypothetical protein